MKTLILTLALVIAAVVPARPAAAVEYTRLDADASEIRFSFRQMGVTMEGRFREFEAQLSFDPERPEAAAAELVLALDSIDTGVPEMDAEALKPDWFDVAAHPAARFVAAQVSQAEDGRIELRGPLTIKGQTREITVAAEWRSSGKQAVLSGEFVLPRLDYEIGTGAWGDTSVVANEVRVAFDLAVLPAAARDDR